MFDKFFYNLFSGIDCLLKKIDNIINKKGKKNVKKNMAKNS
tara:strand:+ start:1138 stop:1260 length:123 start_codon:yes stop_codon:yes gene_type:complete